MRMSAFRHLSLFVTEGCNLRCDYCFAAPGEHKPVERIIAERSIEFFLEHAQEEKSLTIGLWGGEPLLVLPTLKWLVPYALKKADQHERTLRFSMPTNATLLTEEAIDFIQEHAIALSLSIDGTAASQKTRRTLNGKSSFPLVQKKIELLKKKNLNRLVSVRKTYSPSTVKNLYADIAYFIDHGFNSIAFSPVMEVHWTKRDMDLCRQEHFRIADRWIEELESGNLISFRVWDEVFAAQELSKTSEILQTLLWSCGAGISRIAVDVHGDVYPCHRFAFYDRNDKRTKLGNVMTNSDIITPFQRIDPEAAAQRTRNCSACSEAPICLLFCPAVNYKRTGDILTNDVGLCGFMRIAAQVTRYVAGKAGHKRSFQEYIKNRVIPRYVLNPDARFHSSFWNGLSEKVMNDLVVKTESLLEGLHATKEKHEKSRTPHT